MEQVTPIDVEPSTPDAEQITMGAQPPKYTAVDAWMSVHTSKPYTACIAQRILAQVEQNAAELVAEVLYRPGSAAMETGPGLLGPPLACGVRFSPLDPFHGLTKSERGSRR